MTTFHTSSLWTPQGLEALLHALRALPLTNTVDWPTVAPTPAGCPTDRDVKREHGWPRLADHFAYLADRRQYPGMIPNTWVRFRAVLRGFTSTPESVASVRSHVARVVDNVVGIAGSVLDQETYVSGESGVFYVHFHIHAQTLRAEEAPAPAPAPVEEEPFSAHLREMIEATIARAVERGEGPLYEAVESAVEERVESAVESAVSDLGLPDEDRIRDWAADAGADAGREAAQEEGAGGFDPESVGESIVRAMADPCGNGVEIIRRGVRGLIQHGGLLDRVVVAVREDATLTDLMLQRLRPAIEEAAQAAGRSPVIQRLLAADPAGNVVAEFRSETYWGAGDNGGTETFGPAEEDDDGGA